MRTKLLILLKRNPHVCQICKGSLKYEAELIVNYLTLPLIKGNRTLKKRNEINIDVDHILPKSKGGTDVLENLQLTHKLCNNKKGNRVDNYT